MNGFIINLNSEIKEESCVAKLDFDWFVISFAVSFGWVCLGVLGWGKFEVSFGKDKVSLILGWF